MQPLISISEADSIITSKIQSAETEIVAISKASQRILRQEIRADRPIPPFDRVMMDGIAISSEEFTGIGSCFEISGTQAAGTAPLEKQLLNTCFEVMTGATLPIGCDCVIPVEEISITNNSVILSPDAEVEAGKFIHPLGSDGETGHSLLSSGQILNPSELAIAASTGHTNLEVSKLPKVTILTSGDEVIPPNEIPQAFQIRSSHPTALINLIEPHKLGICNHFHLPDDPDITREFIQKALHCSDFIILTGGVSKGKFDYIAPTLTKLIGPPCFHGVKQRPGKPFGFWKEENGPCIFALPGNPVSVMATATRYLLPALRKHQGLKFKKQTRVLNSDANWKAPIPGFLSVTTTQNGGVQPSPVRNSGDYLSLTNTSGFIEIPKGNISIPAGSAVPYFQFT